MGKGQLRIVAAAAIITVTTVSCFPITAQATGRTSAQVQTDINAKNKEIKEAQAKLGAINSKLQGIESDAAVIKAELDDLKDAVYSIMEDIESREIQIEETRALIAEKEEEVEGIRAEYEEALETEKQRRDDMQKRMRAMYERGDDNTLALIFSGKGIYDILNRLGLAQKVYDYDREKLDEYKQTREVLEEIRIGLEEEEASLKEEEATLNAEIADLENEKSELEESMEPLREKSAEFDALVKSAKQEASVAATLLSQEQAQLQALQDQKQKALEAEAAAARQAQLAAQAAAGGTGTVSAGGGGAAPTINATSWDAVIDASPGSDLGKQIAKYGCQFIGCPYVHGGRSLTNGTDCSGFTMLVYQQFGYSLSPSSSMQATQGREISVSEIEPGDILVYPGHVALYIGGGYVVHASTPASGIKTNGMYYRQPTSVRRIL